MDELAVKKREIFFNNLLLLGLDCALFEKKYGIPFRRDMFVLPNKKGYEVVTYFLFSKLSAATKQDYSLPWPLVAKDLERTFQKTTYNHLSSFAQERIVPFPRIVPSLLSTFGGYRFYDVYLPFSSYVLFKTLRSNGCDTLLSMPEMGHENSTAKEEILQLTTVRCVQNFRNIQSVTYASHCVWKKYTKYWSECLERLKVELKENEILKEKSMAKIASLINSTGSLENITVQKVVEKLYESFKPEMRKELQKFFDVECTLWHHLSSEIGENKIEQVLDGVDFDISVSDSLPENCYSQLEKTGFTSSKKDGKLSVVRYIKLLEAFLKFFTEVLMKADLGKLHENCLVEDPSSIQDSLHYSDTLIKRLKENEIPEIEENIRQKKLITGFDDPSKDSESNEMSFPYFPIQSFAPEAVKQRVPCLNPGEIANFSNPGFKKPGETLADPSVSNSDGCSLEGLVGSWSGLSVPSTDVSAGCSLSGVAHELPSDPVDDVFPTEDMPAKMSLPSPSELNSLSLDDLDNGFSSEFPMRDSWLQEPPLSDVTMPDMSFDDL